MILKASVTFSFVAPPPTSRKFAGARQLDDVHRRHGEARAVHHAADLAIERDVVEVELRGREFLGVLLALVAQRHHVGLAVKGVVVEAHLGVEAAQIARVGDDEGVDLDHLGVLLDKEPEETVDEVRALLDLLALEPEREGDAAAVKALDAGRGIDGEGQNLFGAVGGDFLDVHAALGRADKRDAARFAVDQEREVKLARDRRALFDVDAPDRLAGGAGLMRDKRAAEHLRGHLGSLRDRARQPHAALVAGRDLLEAALAAPARVDLRLDDPDRPVELARRGLGVLGAQHDAPVGDRQPVAAQKALGLILVDIHGSCPAPPRF